MDSASNILSITPGETDQEKAKRLKAELEKPLAEICEIFTRGKRDNIALSFQIHFDGMGRAFVQQLGAVKEL